MKSKTNHLSRESVGIKEIDNMIEGGIPVGSVVGLSGPPGVGKSILSLHFLLEGARKGQKSVYINLEEPRKNIDNMIKEFEFADEFLEFEKKEIIIIKCFEYPEYEKIYSDLLQRIKDDSKIGRLVIDSFNCFFGFMDNLSNTNIRKLISESFYGIRRNKLTSLLVLEKEDSNSNNSNYNIPYMVDGMIKLDFLDLGVIERRIFIPKMRWTNQYKESKSYDISSDGIIVEENNLN